jgi:hypothetical protein
VIPRKTAITDTTRKLASIVALDVACADLSI